jgi:CubicO group peptidase (beta-lactamase class C family)
VGCQTFRTIPQTGQQRREDLKPELATVIDKFRSSVPKMMKKANIPGCSLALVDDKGVLWTEGFGTTDFKRKIPVTPETVFSIQSMSKTFTATAVMFAVIDGLVELDTPITEYLPNFTVNSKFEKHPEQKITLRLLLSHRAGFTHEAPVGNNYDTYSPSFEDHALSISDTWLKFPVGQKWDYSNLGIDLAGYILQVRSGMPFTQYVKDKIFDPFNMPHSSMDMKIISENKNRAIGHHFATKKIPLEIPMVAAGGIYTNAIDLSQFVKFHLNFGKLDSIELVDEQILSEMYGKTDGHCLGLGKGKKHDTFYYAHGGGGFGFLTYMIWYPEYGIGAIELTNSSSNSSMHWRVPTEILSELIAKKLVRKKPASWFNKIYESQKDEDNSPTEKEESHKKAFTPTPFKRQWSKYTGKYECIFTGYESAWYTKIALALGFEHEVIIVKVRKKDGYLFINDESMEEFEPGLFFTASGEALDFRAEIPTWRNIKLRKR